MRSPKTKLRLMLLDLFAIVLNAADVALAFSVLYDTTFGCLLNESPQDPTTFFSVCLFLSNTFTDFIGQPCDQHIHMPQTTRPYWSSPHCSLCLAGNIYRQPLSSRRKNDPIVRLIIGEDALKIYSFIAYGEEGLQGLCREGGRFGGSRAWYDSNE